MLNNLTWSTELRQDGNKAKQLRLESLVMHRERHKALIKAGLAEKSFRMFVDQLKNTRAALLDVALERSHSRRLVCPGALGKMQRKPLKLQKFTGNTLI